jgi:hypothetical protein
MQRKPHFRTAQPPSVPVEDFGSLTQETLRQQGISGWVSTAAHQPSTWVQLVDPPTAFSFDQALLLCQCSDDQWLAWIPDYGEILLSTSDFNSFS